MEYQKLFNYFAEQHGIHFIESEMQEICNIVKEMTQPTQLIINNNDEDEDDYEPEPRSVCGDIDGMVNPCCAGYDPLHYKNCGYG